MAEPILDLDTIVERRTIRIRAIVDGVPRSEQYELKAPGEFSLLDYRRLGKKGERVEAMLAPDRDLTDEEVSELGDLLGWLCGTVLMAPPEVLARLSLDQRLAVLKAFTDLQRAAAQPAGEKTPAPTTSEPSPIGESSSPV